MEIASHLLFPKAEEREEELRKDLFISASNNSSVLCTF